MTDFSIRAIFDMVRTTSLFSSYSGVIEEETCREPYGQINFSKEKQKKELWHENSPDAAIQELSSVYNKLYDIISKNEIKWKLEIKPYGVFNFPGHFNSVAKTLYKPILV